jgi:hypothetical protein
VRRLSRAVGRGKYRTAEEILRALGLKYQWMMTSESLAYSKRRVLGGWAGTYKPSRVIFCGMIYSAV